MSSPPEQPGRPASAEAPVLIEVRGSVALIRIHRPERRNALDRKTATALRLAIEDATQDPTVRAIMLSGSGGTFCAGGDLSTLREAARTDPRGTLEEFHALILSIVRTPKPVVAAIAGAAAGFGADLALAADMRIAEESAFLQESFIHVGLLADGGGTMFLPELVGPGKAFELLALGERVLAPELHRQGIVDRVVPVGSLEAEGLTIAKALADRAPLALAALKRTLQAPRVEQLTIALARVRDEQVALLGSDDFAEGVESFLAKRAPVFRGS